MNELNERMNSFLNEEIVELFIQQYLHELDNAYLYKYFSTWAAVNGYPGATKWFQHQNVEELTHAEKIISFLTDAGVYFQIKSIPLTVKDITEYNILFEAALKRETETTDNINTIIVTCGKQNQLLAQEFMNQLLYNQLSEEEEARARYKICMNASDNLIKDHIIEDLN